LLFLIVYLTSNVVADLIGFLHLIQVEITFYENSFYG
jgi:hypothetical protein